MFKLFVINSYPCLIMCSVCWMNQNLHDNDESDHEDFTRKLFWYFLKLWSVLFFQISLIKAEFKCLFWFFRFELCLTGLYCFWFGKITDNFYRPDLCFLQSLAIRNLNGTNSVLQLKGLSDWNFNLITL